MYSGWCYTVIIYHYRLLTYHIIQIKGGANKQDF